MNNPPVVLIWPEAFQDLDDISDYVYADNPEAAEELLEDLHKKIAALPARPRIYRPGRVTGTREMVVRANYVVVYNESPNAVNVLRVPRTARKWPLFYAPFDSCWPFMTDSPS
ncbi:MAG: type II toxin-antitoxin system RelE/ParE family toxin [Deltaproteobacteria bacterium]|nr:type II toxin-antitoxin system RelE/ParE family toxin [Deltaproteobacteria bacterium]